jgi:predicted lipoprotein with Yx(FWY)xxD motif
MDMRTSRTIGTAGVVLVLALAAAGCGAMSSAATGGSAGRGGTVVRTAHSSALGATVLVNSSGRTLYSLSAEQHGKFICTKGSKVPGSSASCLSLWTPLIEHGGVNGEGVGSLGTVKRPDGLGEQVTYRGLPLYSFTQDTGPAGGAGNGFHDVGVWRAATVGSAAPAPSTSTSTSNGYGY